MDIDKNLRGQLSAFDVLLEQAERHRKLIDQVGAAGAAYGRVLGASQTTVFDQFSYMDRLREQATQSAMGVLSQTTVGSPALGGVHAQIYSRAMAAMYTPPDISSWYPSPNVGQALASMFNPPAASGLAEVLARITAPAVETSQMSHILARLFGEPARYHDIGDAFASLTGPRFELESSTKRLADLFAAAPFSSAERAAVRDSLGDWRDPVEFKPNLELPQPRLKLYSDQGMSEDLLDVSADDPNLQACVDEALLDIEDDGNVIAYRLLMHLEQALRQLIQIAMEDVFGPSWWAQRVPPDVRDKCDAKLHDAVTAGAQDTHPIDYADFTDYEKIICRSDNFKQAFKPIFGRVEDVRESLQRLHPVRLICMHSRLVTGADLVLVQFEAPRILARVKPRL